MLTTTAMGRLAVLLALLAGATLARAVGGTGLEGEYCDDPEFSVPKLVRVDPTINFTFGTPAPSIQKDTFSIRWKGAVEAVYTETYTFSTVSDDGVRLWVNGQLLIDNWTAHGTKEDTGTLTLEAGKKYRILLEYYQLTGSGTIRLSWASPSQVKEIIPQAQLFSPAALGE